MSGLSAAEGSPYRIKAAVLVALATATVAFSLFLARPGHVTLDETVYHLMARSFAQSGSFDILNGYQELPSAEFGFPVTHEIGSRLVPQYPAFFPVLAYPFYAAAGYRGLFLLNAFAFVGTIWLTVATARRLFRDPDLAVTAGLVLVLASYAWEYSQAAWPHATSMLFVSGAAYLAAIALTAEARRTAALGAAGAGLVVGFGAGIRADVFFVAPALVLPFLFAPRPRLRETAACVLGMVPGLAALAAVNHLKFGIASPFTYGPKAAGSAVDPLSYLPLLLAGLAVLLVAWCATRPRIRALAAGRLPALSAAALAVGLALLLVPEARAMATRLANGAYQLLIDLRIRDLGIVEGGLSRGPGGGMVYMGALKKSLLQSCPYLVVLVMPLLHLFRRAPESGAIAFLFLVPAAFVGVYAYFAWHGGLCLNLRYFLPILPFTSILAALGWRALAREQAGAARAPRLAAAAGLGVGFAGIAARPLHDLSLGTLETLLLTGPLVLAAILLGLLVAWMLAGGLARRRTNTAAQAALMLALAWSGLVAFAYDYPRAWAKRGVFYEVSQRISQRVAADSVVFTEYVTPLAPLQERGDVRLADVTRDDFADFRPLLEHYLGAGSAAYAWLSADGWRTLEERRLLDGVTVTPISEIGAFSLARLAPARGARDPGPPPGE